MTRERRNKLPGGGTLSIFHSPPWKGRRGERFGCSNDQKKKEGGKKRSGNYYRRKSVPLGLVEVWGGKEKRSAEKRKASSFLKPRRMSKRGRKGTRSYTAPFIGNRPCQRKGQKKILTSKKKKKGRFRVLSSRGGGGGESGREAIALLGEEGEGGKKKSLSTYRKKGGGKKN